MVERRELYESCLKKLAEKGFDSADFDVSCIFSDVLQERSFIKNGAPVSDENAERIRSMTEKYASGYPLQYLLGKWEFYGLPFYVGEGVLIPRQDTETLVEFVINKLGKEKDLAGVDLCAGSGCIAIALDKKLECHITAIEKSETAFEYLEKNIRLNNSGIAALRADVLDEKISSGFHDLDFIVCNPPYLTKDDMENLQKQVSYEPAEALFGGDDGCDLYRGIVRCWKRSLKSGGLICFEIGMGQEDEVSGILIQHGFENVRFIKDYCGVYRVVYGYAQAE